MPLKTKIAAPGIILTLLSVGCGHNSVSSLKPDFSLNATGASVSLTAGGSAQSVSLSVTAINGFAGNVQIAASGLPAGVTATPASLTLAAGAAQSISFAASSSAAAATAMIQFAGTSAGVTHTTSIALTVKAITTPPPPTGIDVTTYHYDNGRTGLNASETTLTPANIGYSRFGLLRILPVDGGVDAQPLMLSGLTVAAQQHNVVFDPAQYAERVGLLLMNGTLYLGWTSHCDQDPYTGWLMAYSESTLQQISVLNLTPNGSEGSIWMAGTGLAADSSGNIYFLDANGTFDTTLNSSGFPSNGDYGNGFMKISTAGGALTVADYFEAFNTVAESDADEDLGSGGVVVLPDMTDSSGAVHHLAVGAGKDSTIYVANRDSMGKFSAQNNNALYQEIDGAIGGVWSMAAYFNNTVYYGAVNDSLKAFPISNAKLASSATVQSTNTFPYPGTTPAVSANGTSSGIVWAVENSSPAVLQAYNATTLQELYNSNQAAGDRDQFGPGNKFITPMIANGKVFVGTPSGVAVFGLLQ